ncbi:FadR family transcriptional regulator [Nocardia panacis]|uniref:FadR family transcriptional regulator n=1 Tax=Nocardia panacis TaxID=2340916 RepID=A0A3A4KE12_9NOCA|nr:FCD domain-containing protein [Nocardia panacis]RJO73725.1 FadR family transcriptional regulator [Nocardia panacis]
MRTHEVVLRRIEQDLAAGRIAVGAKLPPERSLAEELGVGRSSVREAMRVLEAMGIVRTAVGSGPDAGAVVAADPAASIGAALRLHVATGTVPVRDIVQTRTLLECWAVDQAARAESRDLGRVDALLTAMDDPTLTPDEFHNLDADLHVALAALSGNVLIEAMMISLRESIRAYVMRTVAQLDNWPEIAAALRREHHAIVAALRAGDGPAAATHTRHHIETFYGHLTDPPTEPRSTAQPPAQR